MLEVVFLGTSGSMPTRDRGLPAVAVIKEGEVLLLDCGEGTQRQAMRYGINMTKIAAVFITHMHGDHVIGLAGLVRTMALQKRTRPLTVFVPKGGEAGVATLLKFDKALINYPVIVKGISGGKVYSDKYFDVTAFGLKHSIQTYGYTISEPDRIRFKEKEAKAMGIKGPMFSALKAKGSLTVGGKRIKLADVTYKIPGLKVVYATDTRPCKQTEKAAKGADLLIHESSYGSEFIKIAKERKHSTAEEVARIAKAARTKRLVLFHLSARYDTVEKLLAEAKKIFKNTQVAEDGYRIKL